MRIGILQFIKRLSFAYRLARFDSLFVLENFACFGKEVFIARRFIRKRPLPAAERLYRFLASEDNRFLYALAEEVSARSDLIGGFLYNPPPEKEELYDGEVIFKTADKLENAGFYYEMFLAAAEENKALQPAADSLKKRLDSLFDMRFYGAELETLAAQTETDVLYDVNWIRTSKNKLCLTFHTPCRQTRKLDRQQQQKLAVLFGSLLFEHSIYVSFWSGILVDSANNVSFAGIDGIFEADSALKNFARRPHRPQTENEFRLNRALALLSTYCPQVNLIECWTQFEHPSVLAADLSAAQRLLAADLQKHRVITPQTPELLFANAEDIAYLLDASRHRRDPQFRKSTVWYWGPLLIVVYLLFKYF